MARKQVKSKVAEKVEKKQNITTPSEKSVEDIEHDLHTISSDEEEDIEQEELSEEESSGDEEEEERKEDNINGLSDEEQEEVQQQQNKANKSGHSVNKIIKTSLPPIHQQTINLQKSKSGVIYIGRLPSGFQESELKTYFLNLVM